jgi:ATP-binding cassette subfamily C (CFTR/MRP) protein 1
VVFARLIEEYGSLEQEQQRLGKGKREDTVLDSFDGSDQKPDALMQTEERVTGAVSWRTYANYLRFAGTITWAPIILGFLTLAQAAQGTIVFV